MKSLWSDEEAAAYGESPLELRVYTSRLIGREPALVLHGGGNTSVKAEAANLFGEREAVLYIKGSGWDLATIEAAGFAPVRLEPLKRMVELPHVSDRDMVRAQRAALVDPDAPTPSVEAILHAILPFKYVDHTHADAVVAITNTEGGEGRIRRIYGERVLIVPYVMPGFVLAKRVYELVARVDWTGVQGMILMHHGVFTFGEEARTSYERMIGLVSVAEEHLRERGAWAAPAKAEAREDLLGLARYRRAVSRARGAAMIALRDAGPEAGGFSALPSVRSIATRGPLTPDHVIRTKRVPLVVERAGEGGGPEEDVKRYVQAYQEYFARHADGRLTPLDPAPRWLVWPNHGTVAFGRSVREATIASDIVRHTLRAIQWSEALGGWRALPERDVFAVEYWELEQAKLSQARSAPVLQGKVALVTGAASGIGRAFAELLHLQGAAVVAVDRKPEIATLFNRVDLVGEVCDVTDRPAVDEAVKATVRRFGGLDILISNAGVFPASQGLAEMDAGAWERSLEINLSSHQRVLQACIPFLVEGIDPAVVIVGSKNVPAPGPGAGAYSVAKAGLTQLARVAALELASAGVRVNTLHPHGVFDTDLWTEDVLRERAARYGVSVEAYKRGNLLGVEVTSRDVALLGCALVGPPFAKTTGAQIPIDGGNDRVI